MSNNYDNWERLVEAVLRREQFKQLALISSREPSFSSTSSSISGWNTPIRDDRNVQLGSSSSTVNETDWERLLPPDYEDIISRSVIPVDYATKEDLYMSLCSSPILLDGGKMSFHIDKTTGKKCYMISAKELNSVLFNKELTPQTDHRNGGVRQRASSWDIRGQIETQILSPKTRYAAYLIYRFEMPYKDLVPAREEIGRRGIIKFVNVDEDHDAERRATTLNLLPGLVDQSQQIAVTRSDGWIEVQLGMFYNDLGYDGPVEARLMDPFLLYYRHIHVKGIEFRPATNAETEFVSKENMRKQRKGIFSKLRISR